jgi:hypothetical protein
MGGAAKLALGLLLLWISMVCFYFAFHPNGVTLIGQPVANPSEAFQWLIQQFQTVAGGGTANATTGQGQGPQNQGAAPGGA